MQDKSPSEIPVVEILRMPQTDPERTLELLKDARDFEPYIIARFRSYCLLAAHPFVEADVPLTASGDKLYEASSEDTVELCESAIKELVKIEKEKISLEWFEPDHFQTDSDDGFNDKKWADSICAILNRIKPGRVQELRGITCLSYLDRNNVKTSDGLREPSEVLGQETAEKLSFVLFDTPETIQSALVVEYGEKLNGARTLSLEVYRNPNESSSPSNSDAVGVLTLSEDETYRFSEH